MKKHTLLSIPYAKALMLDKKIKLALTYVLKNQKLISLTENAYRQIGSLKSYAKTPIADIFTKIVEMEKLDEYFLYDLSYADTVPELLTMEQINLNGASFPIETPNNLQKTWVNITPYISKKGSYTGDIIINDMTSLQNLIVRGALCASYDASVGWLNPKLTTAVIKSYSMTVSEMVRRNFNLNYSDHKFTQTIFAAYIAYLMDELAPGSISSPLLNRCAFLGSVAEIQDRIYVLDEFLKENKLELTMSSIIQMLNVKGPANLKNLTEGFLSRLISMSAIDGLSMIIALDYPPYWVHQLLRLLSGSKNIISTVSKALDLKKDLVNFANELTISNEFIKR